MDFSHPNVVLLYIYFYKFRKHQIYHYHYTITGYHSNKLLRVNTLHKHKSCSMSQTSEQSFVSVYCVYSVSIDNILMWMLYKGESLQLTSCVYYLCERR
jgi:hypothetical protein